MSNTAVASNRPSRRSQNGWHARWPYLVLIALAPMAQAQLAHTGTCLTADEADLAARINAYRIANGKPAIAVSQSLSTVGQWHVWDLSTSNAWQGICNLHSWSHQRPALWDPVCYTSDHAQAAQMWNKPRQITGNAYNSNGYENSAASSGSIHPAQALSLWQGSPGHNEVILNLGVWAGYPWRAMGIGLHGRFAVAWFGTLADPLGTMTPCADVIFADGFD